MNKEITVVWRFDNGHVWSQDFDGAEFANDFIKGADLMGHPNVCLVATVSHGGDGKGSETVYLKGDPNVF
jgi:hypothetical protein